MANQINRRNRLMAERPADYQKCKSCHFVKPLTDYYLNHKRQDGREGVCKQC